MKKRNIILITILSIVALIGVINFAYVRAKADSGFDSSWDSGGSDWGGSSDWGSSDWGSSSSSWDSSGYSGSGGSMGGVGFIFVIIVFIILWVVISRSMYKAGNGANIASFRLDHSKEIDYQKMVDMGLLTSIEHDIFLRSRFNDFVEIQNAWMNIDYDALQKKLTDELFNQYQMQLQPLEMKGQKNIMDDFNYIDSMVTDVNKENDQITVTLELLTSFHDYLVDKAGNVIRGNQFRTNTMHYEMKFVCNLTKQDNNFCPNCGGKLENTSSQHCPYCGSLIASVSSDWVLAKKEAKRQG